MTRNRHLHHAAVVTAGMALLVCASTVSAQESQFKKADAILSQLENLNPELTRDKPDSAPAVRTEPAPKIPQPQTVDKDMSRSEEVKTHVPVTSEKIHGDLEVRLSEVPPNSRFEFAQGLRVPAYKKGILFVNGKPAFAINNDGNPLEEIAKKGDDDKACVLLSSRSHIQMRGADNQAGKAPTFLSVESVKFMKNHVQNKVFKTAEITFKEKEVKGAPQNGINISISCRLPADMDNPPADYRLKHFSDALGGLFNYRLPQYIEI